MKIDALVDFFYEDPEEEMLMCTRCSAEVPASEADYWDGDNEFLCRRCLEADGDSGDEWEIGKGIDLMMDEK